jgi:biotin operon repressor
MSLFVHLTNYFIKQRKGASKMSKADNMQSILWLFKTGMRMTAKQLAETLEINIRTVYRHIDALCASGVPIIEESGHNGGYSYGTSIRVVEPAALQQQMLAVSARMLEYYQSVYSQTKRVE